MAAPRRRSAFNYVDTGAFSGFAYPQTVFPPDGYCLIEADLHRATTSLEVASFPFLSQLKLRSAINLSAEPLHDKAADFFDRAGVPMLTSRSLEAFDGPYDLWEEAAKEALELLLDADNQPMILLDSPTECESACLVGCLRRLQHWSICSIHDEYHMLTMRNTSYNTSQRFIERFDLDLVTLQTNLPPWFREHLAMLEEEHRAENKLLRQDPERPTRLWRHGFFPSNEASSPTWDREAPPAQRRPDKPGTMASSIDDGASAAVKEIGATLPEEEDTSQDQAGQREGEETEGRKGKGAWADGEVPNYRLNAFVYACPLVSEGCMFTAKAWLVDDDE